MGCWEFHALEVQRLPWVFSVVTVIDALKWAYNPNHSPNLDASPNH